jgi:hypothetical protein
VKQRCLCFLLFITFFIFSSCSDIRPANQPDFQPIQPDPTSTAKASSPASPASQPTSVISDQVELSSFVHSSKRFSISYPQNWQPFERPDGVVFIDPGDHAGYGVFFNEAGQVYSEKELNQYLITFVTKNFVGKDEFAPMGQEQKADGSLVAQFSSQDPNLGPAMNEVRVSQRDTVVFVLYLSATEAQWQISEDQLHRLADTFTVMDTAPVTITPPTTEPPEWVLTGPTSNTFGFFYPSDWEILRQDETSVAVGMPETDLLFEASMADLPPTKEGAEAAKAAAQKYTDTLDKEYKDVQTRPPEKFPLDQISDGTTMDFLYTDAEGVSKAGSIITAAGEGKLYQVVFSSSAEAYPTALQWFNPMYKSFRTLPAQEITTDEPK